MSDIPLICRMWQKLIFWLRGYRQVGPKNTPEIGRKKGDKDA